MSSMSWFVRCWWQGLGSRGAYFGACLRLDDHSRTSFHPPDDRARQPVGAQARDERVGCPREGDQQPARGLRVEEQVLDRRRACRARSRRAPRGRSRLRPRRR